MCRDWTPQPATTIGDGRIAKLRVLGPAQEPVPGGSGGPPSVAGLALRVSLRAMPGSPALGLKELVIQVSNTSSHRREVNTLYLAPTPLASCL
jgi:hypothetical protein